LCYTGFVSPLRGGAPGAGARLIAGQQYKLQFLGLADNADAYSRLEHLYIEQVDYGEFDFASAGGYSTEGGVLTAEFTADDLNNGVVGGPPDGWITFTSVNGVGTANGAFMNGLTIEAVPEPTSLALFGGGAALVNLMRRRHHRRASA
jgi:hypothetical protein